MKKYLENTLVFQRVKIDFISRNKKKLGCTKLVLWSGTKYLEILLYYLKDKYLSFAKIGTSG